MTGREEVSGAALAAALGYAAAWRGRRVVIKVGGSILDEPGEAERGAATAAADVALLHRAGVRAVVVHGGGPEVSRLLDRLDLPATFVGGLRVTDGPTMDVVEMVLSGRVNKRLVSGLAAAGAPAVGISGRDGGLLRVRPHPDAERLGFVGEVERAAPGVLDALLEAGYLPVVSPVGSDQEGRPYNVNADGAAAALAAALGAEKLILLTDVPGVLTGDASAPELRSELDLEETRRLVTDGTISRGMVPKVEACLAALAGGVTGAHIVGADEPHGLLVELFTEEGIGTMIRGGGPGPGSAGSTPRRARRERPAPATAGA